MRRLDGFSAFMVYNDMPRCYQHTLKIAILDLGDNPQSYDYKKLKEKLTNWIEMYPILKWKLARVPLGLNHPVWIHDLDFNIDYHMRRIACPKPGDRKTFNELVSHLYAQPLDKSQPLWMSWVIEGLENNQVALVCLFHHAYTDGSGASAMLEGLMTSGDFTPKDSQKMGVNPHKNPSRLTLLLHGLIDLPLMFCREVPHLVKAVRKQRQLTMRYKGVSKELQPPRPRNAPDSPLNTTYSHGRTFAYETFELALIRRLSKHFGITINDLLVAIISGAVRQYYLEGGYSPDQALVASIPVNIRTEEQKKEILGNYVSAATMWLPIHEEDPIERMRQVIASSHVMKEQIKALGTGILSGAVALAPPFVSDLMNWALRRARGQLKLIGNLAISNVRGPSEPLFLGDAKVVNWLSVGQLFAGVGLNVTAWSYLEKFNVCIMAEEKVIPDGSVFMTYLRQSFDEYQAIFHQEMAEKQNKEGYR